jgi:hypothetical protein
MVHYVRTTVLGLQLFQVLFLALHDWVPLGRFTNLPALRAVEPLSHRLMGTLITTSFFAYGLYWSFVQHSAVYLSSSLVWYLAISYGLLFVGELKAWWVPYLVRYQPERAARYRQLFNNTYTFLPERNGISPNTVHVFLHATTLTTLLLLRWAR